MTAARCGKKAFCHVANYLFATTLFCKLRRGDDAMTYDEVVAAYKFAGVSDPARLAAAYLGHAGRPALAVPACPSCQAGPEDVIWTGGSPRGGDSWRCSACGYAWTTPGRAANPYHGKDLAGQIAAARRLLARPDDEQLGCWSAPPRCAALAGHESPVTTAGYAAFANASAVTAVESLAVPGLRVNGGRA